MSLLALQTRIRTRLEGSEFFSDSENAGARAINVLVDDTGDIEDEVAQAAEVGLLVEIKMPEFEGFESEKHGALHGKARCVVQIEEYPVINRDPNGTSNSLQAAADIADAVAARLHGFKPGSPFFALEVEAIRNATLQDEPGQAVQIYQVIVRASYRADGVPDRTNPGTMLWGDGEAMRW